MSEQIKRYDIDLSDAHHVARHDGKFVLYSDHVAARAADKAEIERLTNICKLWEQRYESTIRVAEARMAELEESSRRTVSANTRLKHGDSFSSEQLRKANVRIAELEAKAQALGTVLAGGYDGGTQINADISLHYKSSEQAEKAFELLTDMIDAAIAAAKSTT